MPTVLATGLRANRQNQPNPMSAGVLLRAEFFQDISATGLLAADILEIGFIPANCRLHRAEFVTVGIDAAATWDVGIMTGTPLDTISTRTMAATAEILNDVSSNATHVAGPAALSGIAVSGADRSIGVRISTNETANAGETIRLTIEYFAA